MIITPKADGFYTYGSNKRRDSILAIIKKKIGRKKSGNFRLHLVTGSKSNLPLIASDISVKFITRIGTVPEEDSVTLDDLLHADIPWSGTFILDDDTLDKKYSFTVTVKNILRFNKFIFQLREICDGKPYNEGLVHWTIYTSPDGFNYDIKAGLKQSEVVEMFQGYYDGVEALEEHLIETGYVEKAGGEWQLLDNDRVVSTIDFTLLGVLFFEPLVPKIKPVVV